MDSTTEPSETLFRARMQALAVPVIYAVFGALWILVSDLVLGAMDLPAPITTKISMVKGWIYVAGSTLLIMIVMRKAWATLERAYAELKVELAERRIAQEEAVRLSMELDARVQERTRHLQEALSELAMFSDLVSHDLRSPLRILSSYAQALEESHASLHPEEGLEYAARIKAVSGRMERMIQGLMELSRHGRSALHLQEFEAGAHESLVDEIWQEIQQNNSGRTFRFRYGPFPPVRCDPRLLEHVWRNLLSNAAKFTRSREVADIQVEFRDGWFRISDNGVGFDNTLASRMFRPFERLHPSRDYEGDGIGLALVSRVIERHGGVVEAEGWPGEGCEVRFRLPA
ncbi:MAG: hypothetical protein IPN71_22580 [Fibrobacteres bacterium]|nr:hypothetical protein [Fibrobacterota bacterium]